MRPQRRPLCRFASAALVLAAPLLQPAASSAALVASGAPIPLSGPAVAMGTGGDLEVAWTTTSGNDIELFAQHLAADGTPTAAPVSLAHGTGFDGIFPAVAALTDGGFVVAWLAQTVPPFFDPPFQPSASRISARSFDAAGQPLGDTVPLTASGSIAWFPRLAPLATGGFVAAWLDQSPTGSALVARRFDSSGQPLGQEIPLVQNWAQPFGLAGLADGGFVAAWVGNASDLVLQRFDAADAAVGTAIRLVSPSSYSPWAVAVSPAGRLIVGWGGNVWSRVLVQSFDLSGNPLSPLLTLAETDATGSPALRGVAIDTGGRFVALWDRSPFTGLSSVNARLYDPSGLALGDRVVLNPQTGENHGADVLAANDGTWSVVWSGALGGKNGTFLQRLNSAFCAPQGGSLCLDGDRFAASVAFHDPASGATRSGHPVPLSDGTGALWFFDPQNPELIVKLIDGTAVNGHHWLFYASLTDVEFDLTVLDNWTGQQRIYHNAHGTLASVADTQAFGPAAPARTAPAPATASSSGAGFATAADTTPPPATVCHFEPQTLCLNQSRFRTHVTWRDPRSGRTGAGQAVQRSSEGGDFWFFGPDDVELAVKILDGRAVNGHIWVFYASLTDVEFDLTVEDAASPDGTSRTYHNPPYHLASAADTAAF